jgi:nucleotide-binding universal stress UspA family protein
MTDIMLVGIDGSRESERAATFAAQRAKVNNARLLVVYVIEWSPYTFNTPEENELRHQRREQEIDVAQERVLTPLLKQLQDMQVDVSGLMRHGHPAQVLNDLAAEHRAIQVFIGRRGHSRLKNLLFGSVASDLVQTSIVPVTVVP